MLRRYSIRIYVILLFKEIDANIRIPKWSCTLIGFLGMRRNERMDWKSENAQDLLLGQRLILKYFLFQIIVDDGDKFFFF